MLERLDALKAKSAAAAAAYAAASNTAPQDVAGDAKGEDTDEQRKKAMSVLKSLKQQKKRALVDLLHTLRDEGLSERVQGQPREMNNPCKLFELPNGASEIEGCLLAEASWLARSAKSPDFDDDRAAACLNAVAPLRWLWQRASHYSVRNIAQLQLLRVATQTQWSPDISSTEAAQAHGAAEQLLRLSLQQRQLLQRLSAEHVRLLRCIHTADEVAQPSSQIPPQRRVSDWLHRQFAGLSHLPHHPSTSAWSWRSQARASTIVPKTRQS